MSWDLGDTVPLTVEITDAQGAPTNASSVTLSVTLPDGTALDPAPSPSNPAVGRYQHDYVPLVAGLHVARWSSTGPATATPPEVVDVRPVAEVSVVSLVDAKAHLNKAQHRVTDDGELRQVLIAAVERVGRHLGVSLAGRASVTASERLAVLEALGDFWRSQRASLGRSNGASGGLQASSRSDPDESPMWSPLELRLTELLGEPAPTAGGSPQGCFPPPLGWPA